MSMRILLATLAATACLPGPSVRAEDYFLTFGGGYAPSGNQVSLEKNFHYVRRVLRDTGHAQSPQYYLFADGSDPGRDVQYRRGPVADEKLSYLLAAVFDKSHDIYNAYRTNDLEGLDGACTPQEVDRYFDDVAWRLRDGDRLLIYYTGHGGKGHEDHPANTSVELWGRQTMRMTEFIERLDRIPPRVPVVLVMVQCFSGGFANVIYNEGSPDKGLAPHNRAGFFATVHDRVAAGCTPDIHEADYQEYSSHFFAGLCGRDRLGRRIERPDYDGDGRISFEEAHAYALLASESIDVSIRTSEVLLRQYSRTQPTDEDRRRAVELLSEDAAFPLLAAAAGPSEAAVLDGLSVHLKLTGPGRIAEARARAELIDGRRDRLSHRVKKMSDEYKESGKAIARSLKTRWPELGNPWHPRVAAILTGERKALLQAIEGHEQFPRFMELAGRMGALEEQRLDLERQWARCQRLIRTAQSIALAANLAKVAPPEICHRYETLLAAERATLE
jgi:hypothetical protein